jgi:hypothetical protein
LLLWGQAFSLPPAFQPAWSGCLDGRYAGQKPGGRLKARPRLSFENACATSVARQIKFWPEVLSSTNVKNYDALY